jgi:hypothetical protein
MRPEPVLVTGATGYVGGRLVPKLLESGRRLPGDFLSGPFHKWIFKGMLRGIEEAVGKPISIGPKRFAPRMHHVCYFDPRK